MRTNNFIMMMVQGSRVIMMMIMENHQKGKDEESLVVRGRDCHTRTEFLITWMMFILDI